MTIALATLLAAVLTAGMAGATTLWNRRRRGPESSSQMLTASTLLLTQLQVRIDSLERRVEHLEAENSAYFRLHGPLP